MCFGAVQQATSLLQSFVLIYLKAAFQRGGHLLFTLQYLRKRLGVILQKFKPRFKLFKHLALPILEFSSKEYCRQNTQGVLIP